MVAPHRRQSSRQKSSLTIREVAAHAGVSTATVSRVLAGLGGAGPEVKGKVLQAVRELDYQPNRMARGLRVQQRKVVAVVIPDLQNPFFTGVVHGVEDVLCESGYTLLLGHSDDRADRESRHLGVLRGEGADGLILVPSNAPQADYTGLSAWKIPIVAVDRAPRGLTIDQVWSDNQAGAREAVQHLLSLGHESVALINGPAVFDVSAQRLAGYREALAGAGITVPKAWIQTGDFRQESGRAAMLKLLSLAHPPRAVLVTNNLMTLGALAAIHEQGRRIPEEVAIIGFDDMPWATSLHPALTAVAQPARELGQAAARLLLERLAEPGRPVRNVILQTQLRVRASCAARTASTAFLAPASRLDKIRPPVLGSL